MASDEVTIRLQAQAYRFLQALERRNRYAERYWRKRSRIWQPSHNWDPGASDMHTAYRRRAKKRGRR
jgi:hypothetical protein